MTRPTIPIYRTTLTEPMIAKILHLAKTEAPISAESMAIIGKLAPLKAKIDNLALTPAYVTTPKESTLSSLGGTESPEYDSITVPNYTLAGNQYPTKEAYWEACYKLYRDNPEFCNAAEILSAKEHKYLNDLMTPEELNEFESSSL